MAFRRRRRYGRRPFRRRFRRRLRRLRGRRRRIRRRVKRNYRRPMEYINWDFYATAFVNNKPVDASNTRWWPIFPATGKAVGPAYIRTGTHRDERVGSSIICTGIDYRGLFQVNAGAGVNDDTYWTIHCVKLLCTTDQLLNNPTDIATDYSNATEAINDALWDTADIGTAGRWAGLCHRQSDPNKKSQRRKVKTIFKKRFIIHQERPALNDIAKQYVKFFVKQRHLITFKEESTTEADDIKVHTGQYYVSVYPDVAIQSVGDPATKVVDNHVRFYWRSTR